MSTTRIIDGVEYTIPPGTEHVWTLPEEVALTPAPDSTPIESLIDNIRVHKIVRLQNEAVIENLVVEIDNLWKSFKNKSINSHQLAEQLGIFRTTKLIASEECDNITVQAFEEVLVKMMNESTK